MTTGSVSPRRADTRRNHERILAAAAASLADTGEVSFNAIARQAEVGVGTVYRHFPTSEALILAVYRREVLHIVEIVPVLLDKHAPDEALRVWVTDHVAHYMMTKKGLADALRTATAARGELPGDAFEDMLGAVSAMLEANVAAGTVRPGLTPLLVMRGLGGLLWLDPSGDWQRDAAELADLLWHGMAAQPG
ncbi:TetR/AcrR family transcriptional regulator [Amycolatopsis sp. lyj-109]|uniref:TetR/AcrR family transcriptional regulator n=1 Tax=Amycolatopsis sp. lyj-109 TaxID=2789287 RepID=UPI003979F510